MSEYKLLPCPFCGGEARTEPKNPNREGNAWGAVYCDNEECATYDELRGRGVTVRDGERVNDERGSQEYIRIAAMRWNRRVPTEAVACDP